jgi:CheY-like chemotaxis protein
MPNSAETFQSRPSRTGQATRCSRSRITIKTQPVLSQIYLQSEKTQGRRVLFVAGETMHTQLLKVVLLNHGICLQALSESGVSNTALITEIPHLVLLDWDTDGIDGDAVLRGLRNNLDTRKVPVILLTNRVVTESFRRKLAVYNVRWVLEKPIVTLSLPKLIEQTIVSSTHAAASGTDCQYQRCALLVDCGQTASGVLWKAVW